MGKPAVVRQRSGAPSKASRTAARDGSATRLTHFLRSTSFLAMLLLAAVGATDARADTRLGESCDLAVLGVKDKAEFLGFDAALHAAIERRDASALAPLVQFPLRLNHADGKHASLESAAALSSRFDQAFGPTVRASVAGQKVDALFCNADGVMYGDGAVWVNRIDAGHGPQFRVTAVNVPGDSSAQSVSAADAKPLLACGTDKFHIVIDGAGASPRYRSWNKPHALPERPAVELEGTTEVEGTGSCAHRLWRFHSGRVEYVVSEPGCRPDTPGGARAQLEVLVAGQSRLQTWCF